MMLLKSSKEMVPEVGGTQKGVDTLATKSQFANTNTRSQLANTIMRSQHVTAVRKAKRNLSITVIRSQLVIQASQARRSLNITVIRSQLAIQASQARRSLNTTHTRSHNARKKSRRATAAQRTKIAWTASPNQSTCWAAPPSLRPSPSRTLVGATSCQVSRGISHASAPWEKTVNANERLSATMYLSGC